MVTSFVPSGRCLRSGLRGGFRDAGHDLAAAEEAAAEVHEFGDRAAVADEFEDLGGDEGDGFRVVEAEAAGEAFLGEEAGVVEEEFFDFVGGEVHAGSGIN